jgi:hypothetical protein
MLADVSQVKPASNNSMISILFVCIIHTPHIILTLMDSFLAIQTRNMYIVDNFLVTSSSPRIKQETRVWVERARYPKGSAVLV